MSKRKNGAGRLSYSEIRKICSDNSAVIHFIGVGGVSMYSLAMLTLHCGAGVSGSDREESRRTVALADEGIKVTIGHNTEKVRSASLVVYSHAISDNDPELMAARESKIPTVSRAEFLGAMMLGYGERIGISGSHGKSTTTAMMAIVFEKAGLAPTVLSGASLPGGSPYKIGGNNYLIYEACEYRDSFLRFLPTVAVGLNLELDHTDYFDGIDQLKGSFTKALGRAARFSLINGDDHNLCDIAPKIGRPVITYGAKDNSDYRYSITSFREKGNDFSVYCRGSLLRNFRLNIPGAFNVSNATAAIAVANEYGIDINTVADAIASYSGIEGRLEYMGDRYGRPIYYDYAHHPTEIAATLNALRQMTLGPITVVFKPHTFSRTASLWQDFCTSLLLADYAVITDIYPAREEPIEGITSQRLAAEIGKGALYSPDDSVSDAVDLYTRGAIVLMGAGNFEKIKTTIIKT